MQTELKTTQNPTPNSDKPRQRHSARYHSSLAQPLITWPDSTQTVVCVRAPDPRVYRDSKQRADIETDIETDINTGINTNINTGINTNINTGTNGAIQPNTEKKAWPWQAVLSTIARWGRGESESRC